MLCPAYLFSPSHHRGFSFLQSHSNHLKHPKNTSQYLALNKNQTLPAKCWFLLLFQVTATFQCYEVANPNPVLISEEQLKAFIAKVQAEKSLQEQLNAEGADPVAISKAVGFSITTEDLKAHRQTCLMMS